MDNKKKAVCSICGKEYDLCLSCRKELSINPWKEVADTQTCYKLYMCLLQFNNGYITKEEARKQLEKIEYNTKDLRDSVVENINEILSTPKPAKEPVKKNSKKYEE